MVKDRFPDPQSYETATREHYRDVEVARAYHQQFASGWSLRTFSHILVARAEQRAVGRLLARSGGRFARVLDIPCGTGKLVPILKRVAAQAVGGDVSRAMMTYARKQATDMGAPLLFSQMDITALPFPDAAFDMVICLRLLHRVPDAVKYAALRELTRVSASYVVISYGITSHWQRVRQTLRRLIVRGDTVPHALTVDESARLFSLPGWSVVQRLKPLPVLSAEEMVLLGRSD